jgi:hypothetical protein
MVQEKIYLKQFIPTYILIGKKEKEAPVIIQEKKEEIKISYKTFHYNSSSRIHCQIIPKTVSKTLETFEVLGLLQAEMSKTYNGCINFTNSDYSIINKVLRWMKKEWDMPQDQ